MSVSPAERRAYVRKIGEIVKRFDGLENDTIKRMIAMLEDARKSIAAELITVEGFDAFRLQQLSENMQTIVSGLEAGMVSNGADSIRSAWQMGQAFVIEPMESAGIITALFNSPSLSQVNVLLDFSADLIRGISAELLQKINAQIRIGALGQQTPYVIMKEITRVMGVKGGREIVGGIASRAETIYRTETNRAFSLANEAQQQIVAQQVPGTQKEWMATGDFRTRPSHLAAHGQVVDYDKPFVVGGENMMHPHDPQASAKNTVNCRCRSITVHPEIGRVITPVDSAVKAEREKRK